MRIISAPLVYAIIPTLVPTSSINLMYKRLSVKR